MSKMSKRKKRRKLSKLLKFAKIPKTRYPIAPPSKILKSKKQYDRKEDKKITKEIMFTED